MISEQLIHDLATSFLEGTDRFIIAVNVKPDNRIRVFIDSDTRVLIEHCIELSKYIESNLNREVEDFELNVSSAGLDQPYRIVRQYIKNIGRDVNVLKTDNSRLSGTLLSANENGFSIRETKKEKKVITEIIHQLLYSEVKETKEIIKF
jgi:ribosome maturation factor RimP